MKNDYKLTNLSKIVDIPTIKVVVMTSEDYKLPSFRNGKDSPRSSSIINNYHF